MRKLLPIFCALLLAPAAAAAAAPAPRQALLQARSGVLGLAKQAGTSSVKKAAGEAVSELAGATFPELWIDNRDADAPTYGTRVFADCAAALRDLQHLSGREPAAAIKLIVGADRGLAQEVLGEAANGNQAVLAAARRELAAGGQESAAGHFASAVRSYTSAWESAFVALTRLVAAAATSVPSADLTAAAGQALGSKKIGLAGPMIEHGQPPLSAGGKPELFFAGSEACPFCGVQRWGMIVALSQFGTFSNLQLMQSDPTERPADRTFTFFGSSYQSPFISFVPVEVWSNVPKGFGLAHLQPLSPSESALVNRFDPGAQTPFIDVANRFFNVNSTVQPPLIAGMSWTQIAGSLTHPASTSAQAIAGEAEVLTAEVCEATNGNPQSVCSSAIVKQYQAALPLLNGKGGGCPPPATTTSARRHGRARRGANPVAGAARHCGV